MPNYHAERGGIVLGKEDAKFVVMRDAAWIALCSTMADAKSIASKLASHEALVAACEAALAYIPGSEVHNWPPGFALKKEALAKLQAALALARKEM